MPACMGRFDTGTFVIVVELELDPSQVEPFKAAIKENGETLSVLNLGV
jgi:hypothetical protein